MRKTKTARLHKELRHPIWDEYIAPEITKLKQQTIESVPRELRPDPFQFVITAIAFPKINAKTRARVFTFIRRTVTAYDAYHAARRNYAKYFRENDHHSYLAALSQFEVCLAAMYQGHETLFALTNHDFRDKGAGGRGELNWRMDRLYNKSKHTEGMIKSQNFNGDTVSMWISNDGLRTQTEVISFGELHSILFDMSLTGAVMAKSHLWRKVQPPLLVKYAEILGKKKAPKKKG
jgi:hypothetical protein